MKKENIKTVIKKIDNDIRGAVDLWSFKSYLLDSLYWFFMSVQTVYYIKNEYNEDYENINNDRYKESLLNKFGTYISPCNLLWNVSKKCTEENACEIISKAVKEIVTNSVDELSDLFDDYNVESKKLGATEKERSTKMLKIINEISSLNIDDYKGGNYDAFGDGYEYVINNCIENAGKSVGQYFSPQCAADLGYSIIDIYKDRKRVKEIYDPTCGSGAFLIAGARHYDNCDFYGQDISIELASLAKMNLLLNGVDYKNINIKHGDTLLTPKHLEKRFDVIMGNPPYSVHWVGKDNPELLKDPRFSPAGVLAPKSKGDMSFIMHTLYQMTDDGVAALICFPGVLYRGGAESKIRDYLIKSNLIDTIINLPSNMFYGTQIQTVYIILKKGKKNKDILFVNAENLYKKNGKNNIMTPEDIGVVVKCCKERQTVKGLSKVVNIEDIEGDSLSVSQYVDSVDEKEIVNIDAVNIEVIERQEAYIKNCVAYDSFMLATFGAEFSEEARKKYIEFIKKYS